MMLAKPIYETGKRAAMVSHVSCTWVKTSVKIAWDLLLTSFILVAAVALQQKDNSMKTQRVTATLFTTCVHFPSSSRTELLHSQTPGVCWDLYVCSKCAHDRKVYQYSQSLNTIHTTTCKHNYYYYSYRWRHTAYFRHMVHPSGALWPWDCAGVEHLCWFPGGHAPSHCRSPYN